MSVEVDEVAGVVKPVSLGPELGFRGLAGNWRTRSRSSRCRGISSSSVGPRPHRRVLGGGVQDSSDRDDHRQAAAADWEPMKVLRID